VGLPARRQGTLSSCGQAPLPAAVEAGENPHPRFFSLINRRCDRLIPPSRMAVRRLRGPPAPLPRVARAVYPGRSLALAVPWGAPSPQPPRSFCHGYRRNDRHDTKAGEKKYRQEFVLVLHIARIGPCRVTPGAPVRRCSAGPRSAGPSAV